MLRHLEEEFRRLVTQARAHGARVLVVGQPWLERAFTPEEELLLWSFGRGRPFEGPSTPTTRIACTTSCCAVPTRCSSKPRGRSAPRRST